MNGKYIVSPFGFLGVRPSAIAHAGILLNFTTPLDYDIQIH
jgi:hypothetical protein